MKFHSVVENVIIRESGDGEVEDKDSDISEGEEGDELSNYAVSVEGRKGGEGTEVGSGGR